MGRALPTSSFALQIAQVVKQFRKEMGISDAELIQRAGLSSNYYYTRLRGDRSFTLDDVSMLADAFNTTPLTLIQTALVPQDGEGGALVTLHAAELERRLRFLSEMAVHQVDITFLLEKLATAGKFVQICLDELEDLATVFRVPAEYLITTGSRERVDRIEAGVEFDRAVHDSGALQVAARSLGQLEASEIRALAAAIRE